MTFLALSLDAFQDACESAKCALKSAHNSLSQAISRGSLQEKVEKEWNKANLLLSCVKANVSNAKSVASTDTGDLYLLKKKQLVYRLQGLQLSRQYIKATQKPLEELQKCSFKHPSLIPAESSIVYAFGLSEYNTRENIKNLENRITLVEQVIRDHYLPYALA